MPKYYTNYAFAGYSPSQFHCTHVYLGELSDEQLEDKIRVITDYFDDNSLLQMSAIFDQRAMFGPMGDRKVLLLSSNGVDLLLPLRQQLLMGIESEFLNYQPHLTTKELSFTGVINRYILIRKDKENFEELLVVYAKNAQ